MGIRKKGYSAWNGKLQMRKIPWSPIFSGGIGYIFSKKSLKFVLLMSALQFAFFVIGVWVTSKPELNFIGENIESLSSIRSILRMYYTNGYMLFTLLFVSLVAGSELISKDIKTNAVSLYFSRPIGKFDYIAGKMSVIGFYLLCVTFIPGLLLVVIKALFSPSFTMSLFSIISCAAFSITAALLFSSFTLLISSFTENSRFVSVIIFVIYFLGLITYGMLKEMFKTDAVSFVSIAMIVDSTANLFFGRPDGFRKADLFTTVYALGLSSFFIFLLNSQISRTEKK
jgi:ABC-type transport system involved in multi-copper enzyme maturation permease subunit